MRVMRGPAAGPELKTARPVGDWSFNGAYGPRVRRRILKGPKLTPVTGPPGGPGDTSVMTSSSVRAVATQGRLGAKHWRGGRSFIIPVGAFCLPLSVSGFE